MNDARLHELALLAEVERRQALEVLVRREDPPQRRALIAWLIHEGYVNDISHLPWIYSGGKVEREVANAPAHMNSLAKRFEYERWGALDRLLGGQPITLRISHKGCVRLAELRHALKAGRDREKFGIMWAGHHLDRDLAIAILDATKDSPVSALFIDMNGMKDLNERFGYDDADIAIKAYLRALAFVIGDDGDVYRKHGEGDEVVAILPCCSRDAAIAVSERILAHLGKEPVRLRGESVALTASCGVAATAESTTIAADLVKRAYTAMQRAKARSKQEVRRSTVCVDGEDEARCL